jgi:hypothetical protein
MLKGLKKLFKPAAIITAGWLGNKFGGPLGAKFAQKITGSLMSGDGAGGDFQIQDTSQAPVNFGGRVSDFQRAEDASVVKKSLRTADGEELRNEWDYRLTKWFRNKDSMFT